jgi:hypothetical protein
MIDQHEEDHNLRRVAAQAFFESIEQLQDRLNEEPTVDLSTPAPSAKKNSAKKSEKAFDLEELEQAVADIEQFFESRNSERQK